MKQSDWFFPQEQPNNIEVIYLTTKNYSQEQDCIAIIFEYQGRTAEGKIRYVNNFVCTKAQEGVNKFIHGANKSMS